MVELGVWLKGLGALGFGFRGIGVSMGGTVKLSRTPRLPPATARKKHDETNPKQ